MFPYYAALAFGILCGICGQIALKAGSDGAATLLAQFLNRFTILGFAVYVLGAIFYIIALKRIPVSLAYPSVSASYIIVGLVAHFLWNEPFGAAQLVGIALIGGGIIMLHQ